MTERGAATAGEFRGDLHSLFAGGLPMDEGDAQDPPRAQDPLRDLGERLDKARRDRAQPARAARGGSVGGSALSLGLRIGAELVVAIVVGIGLGWVVDHAAGTRPAGLIVGFFVGVGAGMWNVYRTVSGMGMAMGVRRPGQPGAKNGQDWSDDDED
jgi:ATP synthase protein I